MPHWDEGAPTSSDHREAARWGGELLRVQIAGLCEHAGTRPPSLMLSAAPDPTESPAFGRLLAVFVWWCGFLDGIDFGCGWAYPLFATELKGGSLCRLMQLQ